MSTDLNIKDDDLILIVAPHPDDESIGMGGFLSKYGKQCDILFVTDGGLGGNNKTTYDEVKKTRLEESKKAMKKALVRKCFFLNIKDRQVCENINNIKVFDIRTYKYIFVPNRDDEHKDHAILYPVFNKMLKRQKSNAVLVEYEVWTPLKTVTNDLDITNTINQKIDLIKCYKSQLAEFDYISAITSLNCYRGTKKERGFAEAYYVNSNSIKKRIAYYLPRYIKYYLRSIINK